jgi:hypothetical protein
MVKFKIEESKENSTYTVKVKKNWYSRWRTMQRTNGQPAIFTNRKAAQMLINVQPKY